MRSRLAHAAYGVLATLLGVAAAHLVAALTDPASSPVLAVGSTVIDLTPTPVKEWAVARFGTSDKPILIGSVFAGVLVLSAVAGMLARRRFLLAPACSSASWPLAGAAALTRPTAGLADVLPAVVAGVVGVAALRWLVRLDGSRDGRDRPPRPTEASPTRRGVLISAGVMAAAAVAMGVAGRQIARARGVIKDLTLPAAAEPATAFPEGLEATYPGIAPLRTPNADFYRIDTRLTLPVIDRDTWTLTIDGDVDQEISLTFDDLLEMPLIERDITLTCVSNEVGGPYVGGTRWTGVRLTDLLDRAGIGSTGADQILSTDVDGMTISHPARPGHRRPRRDDRHRHGRPAAAPRPRLPGADGRPRPVRLRQRLQVDHPHDAHDVRREDGVLDRPRLGDRRADQADEPDRHPQAAGATSRPARPSSAASPGTSTAASRACRCASTAASGRTPRWAPTSATTTGASGTSTGTRAAPASTRSPSAPSTRTASRSPPPARRVFPDGASGVQSIVVNVA